VFGFGTKKPKTPKKTNYNVKGFFWGKRKKGKGSNPQKGKKLGEKNHQVETFITQPPNPPQGRGPPPQPKKKGGGGDNEKRKGVRKTVGKKKKVKKTGHHHTLPPAPRSKKAKKFGVKNQRGGIGPKGRGTLVFQKKKGEKKKSTKHQKKKEKKTQEKEIGGFGATKENRGKKGERQ